MTFQEQEQQEQKESRILGVRIYYLNVQIFTLSVKPIRGTKDIYVDPCDLVWWPNIIIKEVDLPKMAAPGSIIKQQQLDWQSTWRIRVVLIWRNVLWGLSHPFLIYELAEHSKNDDFAQNKAEASFSPPSMHYTPYGQNEENFTVLHRTWKCQTHVDDSQSSMSLVKIFQSDAESFRAFPNISKPSSASQCLKVLS